MSIEGNEFINSVAWHFLAWLLAELFFLPGTHVLTGTELSLSLPLGPSMESFNYSTSNPSHDIGPTLCCLLEDESPLSFAVRYFDREATTSTLALGNLHEMRRESGRLYLDLQSNLM